MKIGLISLATGAAFVGITIAISEKTHGNLSETAQTILLETAKALASNGVSALVTVGTATAAFSYATVKPLSYCWNTEKRGARGETRALMNSSNII